MNTWFWADPHLDHEGIIELCSRPFAKLKTMNKTIIGRYKEVVSPEDLVYIVGDLSLRGPENIGFYRRLLQKTLPGRKILILGNHDGLKPFAYIDAGFESVHTSLIIKDWDANEYVLNHDPAPSCIDRLAENPWNKEGPIPYYNRIWICAHVHDLYKTCQNVINVGVDVWDFYPVNFNVIYELRKEIYRRQREEWLSIREHQEKIYREVED